MSVFGLLSGVAGFVKVRYLIDKAIIDNMIFRCHYRITSAILFVCCIIVTANNLIGDPIACINDGAVPNHVINTYCWITYTFTLPGQHGKHVGTEVAQSGLGNDNQEKVFHSYYQWVPFTLFFQGCLFYVPHYIWKNIEDGKVGLISQGIRGMFALPPKERVSRQKRLVNYILESLRTHNGYSFGYFFCEILNLANVIANIIFIDKFLGGTFLTYGTDVINFSNMNQENRSDPMLEVFPRITKCTFHKYGASGSIQKHDALCVLALNILNEKIYIFLWFWFIILAALSACAILYSALVVMLPTTREAIIKRRFRNGTTNEVEGLIANIQVGDFLLLHLLGQNISVNAFSEILRELCNRLSSSTPSAPSPMEMAPFYSSALENEKETMT
ncbi:innexin inx3 [Sitodiplosis mosellana]|uniref:innexin inx3 n=1 Tax=Sitodiplosis mosellana TaxID=263140 RepID=UPI0024440C77|nr:innexin inx3 [Sitodiplosis mosellana]XP_055305434.1 innexin inx3 [Sitodiplosis mosellana]XP_055305435.1 innexin inx3 [Sitodiplosis mosellana]XP_055305436.1 innexin inx3 [Sitodiplosis mosellana]XP_055305437.1 innexin inx3 [Sitodiplosis mosellana]